MGSRFVDAECSSVVFTDLRADEYSIETSYAHNRQLIQEFLVHLNRYQLI